MKKCITVVYFSIFCLSVSAQSIYYTYDNIGRLTQVTYPDSSTISYTYDGSGNRARSVTQNICFTKPRPVITANSVLTFCFGDSVVLSSTSSAQYAWSTGGTSQNIVVRQSGQYFVTAKYSSTCSKISDTITVTVKPKPIAKITPSGNTSFCTGDSVTLVSDLANFYKWSTGATSPSIIAKTSGNYTLKVTNANGCSDSTQISITSNPLPVITEGGNKFICYSSPVGLGAPPVIGNTYSWSPTTGLNNASVSNPIANPLITTTYTLKTTNTFGCSATGQVIVTVNSLPVVKAGDKIAINKGNKTIIGGNPTVSGNPLFRYKWSPAPDLSNDTVSNPVATPKVTTTYNIRVTDRNGCTNTDSITITVIPANKNFIVYPNPTSGIINIVGAGIENGDWHIRMLNKIEQTVFKAEKVQAMNTSLFYQISLNNLAAGAYYIVLEKGKEKTTIQLIKAK